MANYPFVQSAVDLGRARGPRLAVVWHMAQGGGTVGYLAKPNPNGVSVHFVIEYSGRIVQMLDVTHMHTSLRTSDIRTTDDPDGFYGATAARAVMGTWADIKHGTLGPNHASIGVEMEGFAATGPNAAQSVAMGTLWRDMSTRWPTIRSLGHRDFQDYKPCPGHRVPWALVGGHGAGGGEDMAGLAVNLDVTHDAVPWDALGTAVLPKATSVRRVRDDARIPLPAGANLGIVQTGTLAADPAGAHVVVWNHNGELVLTGRPQVTFTPLPRPVPPVGDCSAAVTAERERIAAASGAAEAARIRSL